MPNPRVLLLAASVVIGACSLGALEGFSSGGPAPLADASDDAQTSDGADGGNDGGCGPDARVMPVRAFDLTLPPVDQIGPACNIDNVLQEDGQLAGLDRVSNIDAQLDGTNVSACIGVELASPVAQITARLTPTPLACSKGCSNQCDSGHSVKIFAAATNSNYKLLGELAIQNGLSDYTLDVRAKVNAARFVAVCRAGWGADRDDVAVDVVTGRCR